MRQGMRPMVKCKRKITIVKIMVLEKGYAPGYAPYGEKTFKTKMK